MAGNRVALQTNIPSNASEHIRQLIFAVYLDESFLHHYHGHQFSWLDIDDYLERPSGKGRRWCFIHAMLENGLVSNTCLIF